MNNYNKIWQGVLGELELSISKASFTTWFKNTFIIAINNDEIIIGVVILTFFLPEFLDIVSFTL